MLQIREQNKPSKNKHADTENRRVISTVSRVRDWREGEMGKGDQIYGD